jgi:3-carboxy-cis,cis-muconate cycloisomerase
VSLELLFADEACAALMSDEKLLGAMARFEGALARASARHGLVPAAHAQTISRVCERARFDPAALAREGRAGTLVIPFVKQLTAQVAAQSLEAARHVHSGATSQDVIDTAAVLCLKPACARVAELAVRLGDAAGAAARRP